MHLNRPWLHHGKWRWMLCDQRLLWIYIGQRNRTSTFLLRAGTTLDSWLKSPLRLHPPHRIVPAWGHPFSPTCYHILLQWVVFESIWGKKRKVSWTSSCSIHYGHDHRRLHQDIPAHLVVHVSRFGNKYFPVKDGSVTVKDKGDQGFVYVAMMKQVNANARDHIQN